MPSGTHPPHVEVAVALIRDGDEFLMVYNPNWEAFSLPMTKRRRWEDPDESVRTVHEEPWADAAARAVVECLGRTVSFPAEPLLEITNLERSGRTREWKRYHLHIHQVKLSDSPKIVDGLAIEWLTKEEILDPCRRPISPTAREVIRQLLANNKLD
jgi:hypothetical protein